MSINPGNYFIVNVFQGESLAVNFNGLYSPLTVTKYEEASEQVWTVSSPTNGLQGISPGNAKGLYIVPGDNHNLMASASPGGITWSIEGNSDDEYTIQTEDGQRIWDIQVAEEGQDVTWQSPTEVHNDLWKFVPVPNEEGTDLD